jgi:hypothetical protein
VKRTSPLLGAVIALAAVAAVIFIGVVITEMNYAADHPYGFGPAHVIAWTAGAGAAVSAALGLLGFALLRAPTIDN